jgi:hypothetical protein
MATGGGSVNNSFETTVSRAVAGGGQSDNLVEGVTTSETPAIAKQASAEVKETNKENDMSKLADLILEKLAGIAEVSEQTPGNQIQAANQVMDAQAAAKVQPTPGSDQEVGVNQIFQAIVAKARGEGAGDDNLVAGVPAPEGAQDALSQGGEEEQEKAAAVSTLVKSGFDFDTAVDLVKQAEVALIEDAWDQEKQAAFDSLINAGVDFDSAVSLVKQAEDELLNKEANAFTEAAKRAWAATKGGVSAAGNAIRGDAKALGGQLSNVRAAYKDNKGLFNKGMLSTLKAVAGNRAVQTGAGALGVAGAAGAYALSGHKKEAFDALIAEGIDFDTAVTLIKQAEHEVYGQG